MALLNEAGKLYVGSQDVLKAYVGSSLVWQPSGGTPTGPTTPPSFRSVGTALTGLARTSMALALPAGFQANDILIANVYKESTAAVTAPSGWQPLDTVTNTGFYTVSRYWKRAVGDESGTQTFSWTGSTWSDGRIEAYSGCVTTGDPYELIGAAVTQGDNVATTSPAISGSTTAAQRLVLWSIHNYWGGAYTNIPSGWTGSNNDGACAVSTMTRAFPTASSFGPLQATSSLTGTDGGINNNMRAKSAKLVALIPAA